MSELKKKLIRFPVELIEDIETYQHENRIPNFTQTVLTLLKKVLESEGIIKK